MKDKNIKGIRQFSMTKATNFPSLEEKMRRYLLTDSRYLDAFKDRISGSQRIQDRLQQYGGIEVYLHSLVAGEYQREDTFTCTVLLVEATLQNLVIAKTLLNRVIDRQGTLFQRIRDANLTLTSQVVPKLETLQTELADGLSHVKDDITEVKGTIMQEAQNCRDFHQNLFDQVRRDIGHLRTIVETGDSAIGLGIGAAVATLTQAIVTTNGTQTLAITGVIEEKTATISAAIGEVPDKVSEKIREKVFAITEQVTDQVALKIVGERYYK